MLARRIGGRQGLTSTVLVILGISLVVVPTWLLMNSFADSIQRLVSAVHQNTLRIPPPSEGVRNWPIVGKNLYDGWSQASGDLSALVQSMQPKIGALAREALSMVASIGGTMLLFLASFIVANILMAYGESVARSGRAIFARVAGSSRGESLANLALSTIRAVALGVIGVAAIQSLLIGLALLAAGIPVAGVLAIVALVLELGCYRSRINTGVPIKRTCSEPDLIIPRCHLRLHRQLQYPLHREMLLPHKPRFASALLRHPQVF